MDCADKSSFTFALYDEDVSRNRYRYGLMVEGTGGLAMKIYTIFADTTNALTILNPVTGAAAPWTGTLSFGSDGNGTLTLARSEGTAYGGVRIIWFN